MSDVVNLRHERARRVAATGFAAEWLGGDNFLVRSHSDPAKLHGVEKGDERWVCDCADRKKHRGGKCLHVLLCERIIAKWDDETRDGWPIGYKIRTQDLDFGPEPSRKLTSYGGALRRVPPRIFDRGHRTYSAAYQRARRSWPVRIPELLTNLLAATNDSNPELFEPSERHRTVGGDAGRPLPIRAMVALLRCYFPLMSVQRAIQCCNEIPAVLDVIGGLPKENTIGDYFEETRVLDLMLTWLAMTARVFVRIVTVAVADATFFSTAMYENWLGTNRGRRPTRPWNMWIKGHVISDAATRAVCAVIPTRERIGPRGEGTWTIHDSKQAGALLAELRRVWPRARALLGDKGYANGELLQMCRAANIKLIVPPTISMGRELQHQFDVENLYYSDNAAFEELYRYRSVIESIFAATKGVSGQYLSTHHRAGRATTPEGVVVAQATEMVAKFLIYNLRRIVFFEQLLGETMTFWPYFEFSRLSPEQVTGGRTLLTGDHFTDEAA